MNYSYCVKRTPIPCPLRANLSSKKVAFFFVIKSESFFKDSSPSDEKKKLNSISPSNLNNAFIGCL